MEGDKIEKWEEHSEKKTTKLGYFLLFLMVIFILTVGQTIFSDLRSIPTPPLAPSTCVSNALSQFGISFDYEYSYGYGYDYYGDNCVFNEIDKIFDLEVQYMALTPDIKLINQIEKNIQERTSVVSQHQNSIKELERRYSLSLQEKGVNETGIYDKNSIQAEILSFRERISFIQKDIQALTAEKERTISKMQPRLEKLTSSYNKAREDYRGQVAWYTWKMFLLMLLFAVPFFALALRYYFRLKANNSPYTIIWMGVAVAAGLLFLQVVFEFLYRILPWKWLEFIWEVLLSLPFARFIIYYGTVALVIAIFGGAVYYIQKYAFNPKLVSIRRIKDGKCPHCSFSINPYQNFCPKCGYQIKERCQSCGEGRMTGLPYCPICGKTPTPEV